MVLSSLAVPIVQAPMAGGPSNPKLAAAVSNAGGLGFLAGGYKTVEALREEILAVQSLTDAPYGVNLFVPSSDEVDPEELQRYRKRIEAEAERLSVTLGEPLDDDDGWDEKVRLLQELQVPVVSFTFGCPSADVIAACKRAGSEVVVTVTTPEEALEASRAGADALCVQGIEAGGHRASFANGSEEQDRGVLVLLRLIAEQVDLPLIAAGGLMHGRDVAAVLAAGAAAAQLGTAFLRCPESGAHPQHKAALANPDFALTSITRAFSGRRARGLTNRFMAEHTEAAPAAYPHLHHMTKELRKAAGLAADPGAMSLWAGQGHPLTKELPAAELVRELMEQAREGLRRAADRLNLETRS